MLLESFESGIGATDTFTVLTATSSLGGAFANVASGDRLVLTGGHSFQVDYAGASVVLSDFLLAPEPGSASLLLPGLALLGLLRRRL